jgi:hypothetical protein
MEIERFPVGLKASGELVKLVAADMVIHFMRVVIFTCISANVLDGVSVQLPEMVALKETTGSIVPEE